MELYEYRACWWRTPTRAKGCGAIHCVGFSNWVCCCPTDKWTHQLICSANLSPNTNHEWHRASHTCQCRPCLCPSPPRVATQPSADRHCECYHKRNNIQSQHGHCLKDHWPIALGWNIIGLKIVVHIFPQGRGKLMLLRGGGNEFYWFHKSSIICAQSSLTKPIDGYDFCHPVLRQN